ncbi:MFS transporter, partial [bacterium]|nr:MFS transporter [bacterium]
IFGDQVLHMDQGLLIGYFLMIQFTAFLGSLIFGRITTALGNKRTLLITLFVWCAVVLFAFGIGWSGAPVVEYFIIGIVAGMVMGASQAVARGLQGTFTPEGREAEFFGFFAVSGKFAAIFGPLTYGIMVAITGSLRTAILALIVFFAVGIVLLWRVDEEEGREAARAGIGTE